MSIRVIQRVLDVVMVTCWFFWYMMSRQQIDCDCGISKSSINKLNPTFYPWTTKILVWDDNGTLAQSCTGSLVASAYVITVASCLRYKEEFAPSSKISVIVGIGYKSDELERFTTSKVSKVHIHENVTRNKFPFENNIALLELTFDIDISEYNPACLAFPGHQKNKIIGKTVEFLQMKINESKYHWKNVETIVTNIKFPEDEIVVFFEEEAGAGDIGAPLMFNHMEQNVIIGMLSSYSLEDNRYKGFLRVSNFHDWIEMTINKQFRDDWTLKYIRDPGYCSSGKTANGIKQRLPSTTFGEELLKIMNLDLIFNLWIIVNGLGLMYYFGVIKMWTVFFFLG